MKENQNGKRLTWYFILAFGLAWILQIIASICSLKKVGGEETSQLIFTGLLAICMFMPFVATLISAKITGEKAGIKIRPNLKGHVRWYLCAWLLTTVLVCLGAVVYFAICRDNFDPKMTVIDEALRKMAASGQNVEGMTPMIMLVVQFGSALVAGPTINALAAFGEEAGWRGYMTPALVEKLGRTKGLLLSGVIWGAWHWPVVALVGYNFGTGYPLYPIPGLLAMCLACTALGIWLSYLYEKVDSILVPSIAHGAVNSIAGIGGFFLVPGVTSMVLGPGLGVLSVLPFVIVSAVLLFKWEK